MQDPQGQQTTAETTQAQDSDGSSDAATTSSGSDGFSNEDKDTLRIQSTIGTFVGQDAAIELSKDDLKAAVGGVELDAALGNAEEIRKRQHLLDPDKYELELKKPNPGKMPNNEDAYPVDLKIEELEVHQPRVKIQQWNAGSKEGIEATKAALLVASTAEKRIVKLENLMSTFMRLLFRLGARVPINCVYWGGTTPFTKYKGIRCLKDERIEEGQDMQLDQCLYCTRFEPVIG